MPKPDRPTRNFFSLTHPMGKSCVIENKVKRGGVKKFLDFFLGRQRAKRRFLPLFSPYFRSSAKTRASFKPIFYPRIEAIQPQLLVPPRTTLLARNLVKNRVKVDPRRTKMPFFRSHFATVASQANPRKEFRALVEIRVVSKNQPNRASIRAATTSYTCAKVLFLQKIVEKKLSRAR